MIRLLAATVGLVLCIKMMINPTDTLTFGLCGLFMPIFFVYGWMSIEKMNQEDE
jgi:ABC-type multidrug transport system permease subunit